MNDMHPVQKQLSVFVVGEVSGRPCDWSAFGHRHLVIASSPEEACEIAEDHPAVLVDMSRPAILMSEVYSE